MNKLKCSNCGKEATDSKKSNCLCNIREDIYGPKDMKPFDYTELDKLIQDTK